MLLLRRDNIDRALQIFRDKCFYSPWEPGERDGGMNFLGIQGEQKVHELQLPHSDSIIRVAGRYIASDA